MESPRPESVSNNKLTALLSGQKLSLQEFCHKIVGHISEDDALNHLLYTNAHTIVRVDERMLYNLGLRGTFREKYEAFKEMLMKDEHCTIPFEITKHHEFVLMGYHFEMIFMNFRDPFNQYLNDYYLSRDLIQRYHRYQQLYDKYNKNNKCIASI